MYIYITFLFMKLYLKNLLLFVSPLYFLLGFFLPQTRKSLCKVGSLELVVIVLLCLKPHELHPPR